jgi:hypothetical protein
MHLGLIVSRYDVLMMSMEYCRINVLLLVQYVQYVVRACIERVVIYYFLKWFKIIWCTLLQQP